MNNIYRPIVSAGISPLFGRQGSISGRHAKGILVDMSGERIRLVGISLWLQAGFRAAKYGPHDPVAGCDTATCESVARVCH